MEPNIIGITGYAGSGKDTVAGIIENTRGYYAYRTYSFAGPLKRFCEGVFGLPLYAGDSHEKKKLVYPLVINNSTRERFYQKLAELIFVSNSREEIMRYLSINYLDNLRNAYVSYTTDVDGLASQLSRFYPGLWIKFTDVIDLCGDVVGYTEYGHWVAGYAVHAKLRVLLQKVGTEFFREVIDKDFWVSMTPDKAIIPDVRFPNEFNYIKSQGGIVIRVDRRDTDIQSAMQHESEAHIHTFTPDHYIYNTGTIKELEDKVKEALERY